MTALLNDPNSAKGNILRAAAALFREKGFNRTTVRDIAADVGILSGSLFHHFPNKEAILAQLMEELILLVDAEMQKQMASVDDPGDQLTALVHCELRAIYAEIGTGLSILVTEWRALSEASQARILGLRADYEARWLSVLSQLAEQGRLTTEPFLARQFIRGAAMETWHWYKPDGRWNLAELAAQLSGSFMTPVNA
ncbi:TetR/AcrR family transcriptional regulator [Simiduia agarivorans]|uniref:Transcriptional regulator n=1 Tax=Simiduia agarivorans (strain DSM 21679 / JCM 13881 / BCRC 17597 / SA1) TaxID=1117647 RepID=K4KI06_SIMAS|nr:TetR/AcrR family transcriptional regulator [Simiduia agarivorans]AFU97603.1 transcriptional regulator [Simiduia agarivorans SA1 = DSM 21679]